jgi:hypothetical protein
VGVVHPEETATVLIMDNSISALLADLHIMHINAKILVTLVMAISFQAIVQDQII